MHWTKVLDLNDNWETALVAILSTIGTPLKSQIQCLECTTRYRSSVKQTLVQTIVFEKDILSRNPRFPLKVGEWSHVSAPEKFGSRDVCELTACGLGAARRTFELSF